MLCFDLQNEFEYIIIFIYKINNTRYIKKEIYYMFGFLKIKKINTNKNNNKCLLNA